MINSKNLEITLLLKRILNLENLKDILSVCRIDEHGNYLKEILKITFLVEDKDKNKKLFIGVVEFKEAIQIGYAC
jgi:hypothetical protein